MLDAYGVVDREEEERDFKLGDCLLDGRGNETGPLYRLIKAMNKKIKRTRQPVE
jgi:hypothetical protein